MLESSKRREERLSSFLCEKCYS